MPIVNIPGVGRVNFPSTMSEEDIGVEANKLWQDAQDTQVKRMAGATREAVGVVGRAINALDFAAAHSPGDGDSYEQQLADNPLPTEEAIARESTTPTKAELIKRFKEDIDAPKRFGLGEYNVFSSLNWMGKVLGGFTEDLMQGRVLPTPERGIVPTFSATSAAATGTPESPVTPRSALTPAQEGVIEGAKGLPPIFAGMAAVSAGVPPPLAYAITMGGTTLAETGDYAQAAKSAAVGAILPGVGNEAKQLAGRIVAGAVKNGVVGAGNVTAQKAVEAGAELLGIVAFNETMQLPGYAQMNPEERKAAFQKSLFSNLAFLPMMVPGIFGQGRTATQEHLADTPPAELAGRLLKESIEGTEFRNPELKRLARGAPLTADAMAMTEADVFIRGRQSTITMREPEEPSPTPLTSEAADKVVEPPLATTGGNKPRLTDADVEDMKRPDARRDLKAEGVTPENIEAILSGKKTPQQVVDEQLGIKRSFGSVEAETMIVEENPDGSRSIGFNPKAGPASSVPVNVGTMSHADAIEFARAEGVRRIQEILEKQPPVAPKPGQNVPLTGAKLNAAFRKAYDSTDPQTQADIFGEMGYDVNPENGRFFMEGREREKMYLTGEQLAEAKREFIRRAEQLKKPAVEPGTPEPPPGPYRLTKAVTLPGEKQTYGVTNGHAGDEGRYSETGLTKKQAEARIKELNSRPAPKAEPKPKPEPPVDPNAHASIRAEIGTLKQQLAKEQKALDKNIAKMGSMVPPPIVAEVTRKIGDRMAKIQDKIDALEKQLEPPESNQDFVNTLDALTPAERDNVLRTLRATTDPARLAALKEGFKLTNKARHDKAGELLDLATHLTEPVPDTAAAREKMDRVKKTVDEFKKELNELAIHSKRLEALVTYQNGPRYKRGTIKPSAKSSDRAEYQRLRARQDQIGRTIQELHDSVKAEQKTLEAAEEAAIINDPKQPLLRRIDRKIRALQSQDKEIPTALTKAKDAEVKRIILEKYPDATPEEIKRLYERVVTETYFGRSPWDAPGGGLSPHDLRRAGLQAAVDNPGVSRAQLSPELLADIDRHISNYRPFTTKRDPVEPLTIEKLAELKERIKTETEAVRERIRKEQEQEAAVTAAEKAKEAQLIAEAQAVVNSAKRVGTVGGRTALEVKEELASRIMSELEDMATKDHVNLKESADTPGEYAAQGDTSVAFGSIEVTDKGKFKVEARRPGGEPVRATVDTKAEAEAIIKAMASSGRGTAIIAIPGDGVFRLVRNGEHLLKAWSDVRKISTTGGSKREARADYKTTGGAEKPPSGAMKIVADWNEAKAFHGLEPGDKIASWSARLREFADKVGDKIGKATSEVTVADVEAWIKAKAEADAKAKSTKPPEPEEQSQSSGPRSDPWTEAQRGDEAAFDHLEEQLRAIYPEEQASPESSAWGRPNPDQVHTPQQFADVFNRAFAARNFEKILNTIKASDLSTWKPMLKELFRKQATDPIAAAKAEWFRHVMAGTVPPDAIPPRPRPAPGPAPGPTPPPGGTGPRPSGGTGPRPGTPPPGGGPRPGSPPPPPRPPPYVPPPRIPVDPIMGGTAKSPYQIIGDFSAAIGKALRILKLKKSQLGVYRPSNTMTAQRFASDLDTAAHELAGHWTDDRYGIGKPWIRPRQVSPYDTELAQFWVHGSVTPSSTLRYRRAEGIAEFIRAYVMNPTAAKTAAPNFSAYFERTLPPDALKAIQDFSNDVRTYAGADPLTQGGLNIRLEPPTLTQRLYQGMRGRGFGFEVGAVDWFRQRFDDPYHYAVKAFELAAQLQGKKVLPEQDFELLTRLLAGHDRLMSRQLETGLMPLRPEQRVNAAGKLEVVPLTDPVTKQPMNQEWLFNPFDTTNEATFQKSREQVSAYMVAQRTLEKADEFGRSRNLSGAGAGLMSDVQAARRLIAHVEADPGLHMLLEEGARRYRLWASKNIDILVDAGRITPEHAQDIRDRNEYYVDMHRLSEDFDVANLAQRDPKIGTASDRALKKMKGSSLQIDDVYANLLGQTDSIQKEARRNMTMNAFTDQLRNLRSMHGADRKDFDQFGTQVAAGNRNTINIYRNGHLEHWKFDKDIYTSLKGLGELGTNEMWTTVTSPMRLVRYMITHGPKFIIRNILRDTVERALNSITGGKPWDILKGYSTRKEDLARFEAFGGGQFGNYMRDKTTWHRELKRISKEMAGDPRNILLDPLKLKRAWEALAEKSETMGRMAEFRTAFEEGRKQLARDHPNLTPAQLDYNAALWAAGQARGLMDFAKAGTWMRYVNQAVPFSNAAMRGLGKSITGIGQRPGKFLVNWSMYVLAPTMAMLAWNRSDKERWAEYQQLPGYRKDLFWNFKVGDHWFTIPKPHLMGVLAGGVERAIIRAFGDKRAMDEYARDVAQTALPISDFGQAAGPGRLPMELAFNLDTFRNRPIVPEWEKDLDLELRGPHHASGAGAGVAAALNVTGLTIDPRQVDHVINSMGGWGNLVTDITRPGPLRVKEALLKGSGLFADVPGPDARDVKWVFDWAKRRGELNNPRVQLMRKMRNAVFEAQTQADRVEASKKLREYSTKLRDSLGEPFIP